jgi:heptosyltransferase-2
MAQLDRNKVQKILVRGPNWIGDAIMCTPALAALRSGFPHAHLTLLVNATVAELLKNNPHMDKICIYDRSGQHRGLAGKFKLSQELSKESFDLAVLFQNAFEAALLAKLAKIPIRYGYPTDGRGFLLTHHARLPNAACHQVEYYLHLLEAAGLKGDPKRLWLVTTDEENEAAKQYIRSQGIDGGSLVGINPGATYGAAKRWSTDRYAQLADRLIESQKARVVIFGGPGEESLGRAIASQMRHSALLLSGRLTVRELMAMIQQCALLITNDSGPMHIAAALGIPLVAIFGPTDPQTTSPWGEKSLLLRKPVDCSPCLLRECPIDHRCMTRMAVDEVFEAAEQQLKAQASKVSSQQSAVSSGTFPAHSPLITDHYSASNNIAVFLDRDGTINEDVGYLDSPDGLKLIPRAAQAIRQINEHRLKAVVLTNQSGVARGYYSEGKLDEIHQCLQRLLAQEDARLDGIYYCVHHPDEGCDCRKPSLGMLREASRDLSIDLSQSYVVGDKLTDIQLARNAGAKGILVLTGHGQEQAARLNSSQPAFVAKDLFEAVRWILEDIKKMSTVIRQSSLNV